MRFRIWALGTGFLALAVMAQGAQIGATAESVLPSGTRQLVSVSYRRLGGNPVAMQIEKQVLPQQMRNVTELLTQGGVDISQDLNQLSFATYDAKEGLGLLGVAEGNFEAFKTSVFFHPTSQHPVPPQYHGIAYYHGEGLSFFLPDPTTLVFGSTEAIQEAIDVQQGAIQPLTNNSDMVNLISGTQSTDIWSVLDATGARGMIKALAGDTGRFNTASLASHFDGARYTIQFDQDVKVNMQLMSDDAMSAGLASTGLRAAVLYKQYQAKDPALKALLGQVQVDSAGNDTFLQVKSPQDTVAQLLNTDLFKSIMR